MLDSLNRDCCLTALSSTSEDALQARKLAEEPFLAYGATVSNPLEITSGGNVSDTSVVLDPECRISEQSVIVALISDFQSIYLKLALRHVNVSLFLLRHRLGYS